MLLVKERTPVEGKEKITPISAIIKRLKRQHNYTNLPFIEKLPIIVDIMLNNKFKQNIQKIYLFGSYAYGEPNEDSDIDIFVIIDDEIIKYRLEVACNIRNKLWNEHIIPSDLLVYNEETFNKYKNTQGIERIIDTYGVLIYERE